MGTGGGKAIISRWCRHRLIGVVDGRVWPLIWPSYHLRLTYSILGHPMHVVFQRAPTHYMRLVGVCLDRMSHSLIPRMKASRHGIYTARTKWTQKQREMRGRFGRRRAITDDALWIVTSVRMLYMVVKYAETRTAERIGEVPCRPLHERWQEGRELGL